jgi:hypothetical protein
MALAGFKIVKVRDSKPEAFLILELDTDTPERALVEMSDGLTASELRGERSKVGVAEADRDLMIQEARENSR